MSDISNELLYRWYESAPYGEQTPADLARLLVLFANTHGLLNLDGMEELLSEAPEDDPVWQLFSCIFKTASAFTINLLSDAVYDRNSEVLRHIGLRLSGTLCTQENDPNPTCQYMHIMHPNHEGRAVFEQINS